MESARDLADAATPVALIAAERDTIVPPPRTAALRRSVGDLAFDRTIPDAGHNDIYDHPLFRPAMRAAMERLRADQQNS